MPERQAKALLPFQSPTFWSSAHRRFRTTAGRRIVDVMGEVTVTVKLTNFMERERSETGEQIEPRSREVLAVIDTGAVRSVIPATLAAELGLRVRPGRKTTMADGRTVIAGVAQGLILELFGRETQEEAIVLGDEVLIGQTTLEATDVVVDCRERRAYPNPAHPDGPVWKVR